mgnify:CR=1 FL=1
MLLRDWLCTQLLPMSEQSVRRAGLRARVTISLQHQLTGDPDADTARAYAARVLSAYIAHAQSLSHSPDAAIPRPSEKALIDLARALADLDRAALRSTARAHFGFSDDAVVLLVFGGSQGAQSLNRAVSAAAPALAARGVSVLHAHGPKNTLDLPAPDPEGPPYVAVPYLSRMDLAYAAADLAVCRSGAMTVAEVSAAGLPAVYVPLPIGNGEQRLNALPVVRAGGGLLVDDADLTPQFVADTVGALITDAPRLAAMTAAAAGVGHRDAAERVARIALEVAGAQRNTEVGS